MKVAIINAGNITEVHADGCADVKKSAKRNRDEAWVIDVDSLVDLSHTYWNDQIGDTVDPNTPEGWATAEAWVGEFKVLPCAKELPFKAETDEVAPEPVKKPAKAKGTSRSAEARRRIMDRKYAEGYQAALEDIRVALEAAGEAAVAEWLKNNTTR